MADVKGRQLMSGFSELTSNDIATYIGRTFTDEENSVCNALIASAEMYFANQTNRNYLVGQNYWEYVDGGTDLFYFANFPIDDIVSIELDGTVIYDIDGESNTLVLDEDFYVYDDRIKFYSRQYSTADSQAQAIKIVYTLGKTFNDDAKLALKLWVANFFLNREMGGKDLSSASVGGISQNFTNNVPELMKTVINSYKRYNV